MDVHRANVAAESLPSEVASLDAAGTIIWANAAWRRAALTETGELLSGCSVGVNFPQVSRAAATAIGEAVAAGIEAVITGDSSRFEIELSSTDGSQSWKLQAGPLRDSSRGAVLMRTAITSQRDASWGLPDTDDLPGRISRLTPRERDVLRLMIRGLSNREIAANLGISYTTVRSYAQAVIEKLDARSRLQAVARVARGNVGGIVKKTAPLGIGDQDVGIPAHIGLFYDAEPDLRLRQLEFLRPAIDDPRQGIVLFGPPGVAHGMLGHLEADLGRSLESEVRSGRLLVAQTDSDPDQLLENMRDALARLATRGSNTIRFIADVKWGAPGFPMPEDALWVESRVNEMLEDSQALVVCAYDVSRLPDRALVYGGLDTHPHVVIGDRLKENPGYLAPAEFMRALLEQLRASTPTSGGTSEP